MRLARLAIQRFRRTFARLHDRIEQVRLAQARTFIEVIEGRVIKQLPPQQRIETSDESGEA